MKTVVFLGVLGMVTYFLFHRPDTLEPVAAAPMSASSPAPPSVIPRTSTFNDKAPVSSMQRIGGGGGPLIPTVLLGTDEQRKFSVTIRQVILGGTALANGCFYDIAPSVTTSPEQLGGIKGNWTQAGEFYISGMPDGLIDGQEWMGWLTREGTKTYTTALGTYKTVPSYRVAATPPTVTPKPAPWVERAGHTSLDQAPRDAARRGR